jgi:hypothetical protein
MGRGKSLPDNAKVAWDSRRSRESQQFPLSHIATGYIKWYNHFEKV